MSENIVVGITANTVAHRVTDWVRQHARVIGARVELITVVASATGAPSEERVAELARRGAQSLLDEHAAALRAAGVDVSTRVEAGDPVGVLTEASLDATLLVIGSDHRGPSSGTTRGAHGIRTAAAAHCPVVVVPDIDLTGRTGVLVGTDGSEVSAVAVEFAAAEAERLGETLIAVSVWTPMPVPGPVSGYPEPYLDGMQDVTARVLSDAMADVRAAHPGLTVVEQVETGYPSAVINDLARTARLTVVGSHGRGALARLLLGSISHEVLARLSTVTAIVR